MWAEYGIAEGNEDTIFVFVEGVNGYTFYDIMLCLWDCLDLEQSCTLDDGDEIAYGDTLMCGNMWWNTWFADSRGNRYCLDVQDLRDIHAGLAIVLLPR